MRALQIRAVVVGLVLAICTGLCSWMLLRQYLLVDQLLPGESTAFPWEVVLTSDVPFGGNSQLQRQDDPASFTFQFL